MSSRQDDIQTLQHAIMQEATAEAQRILGEARTKVAGLRQEAHAQLEADKNSILADARDKAEDLVERTVAEVRMEAQSLRLERRERLIDHVFAEARSRMADTTQWPEYGQVACFLVRDAAEQIDSDRLVVHADARTAQQLDERGLESIADEVGIQLDMGSPLEGATGVVVETPDGHRRFDNTLEQRLRRFRDRLRAPVFHILMGEDS